MTEDDDLRRLAEAALERLADQAWNTAGSVEGREQVHDDRAAVLALLARLRAAEEAVARVEALADCWAERPGMVGIAPALRAALGDAGADRHPEPEHSSGGTGHDILTNAEQQAWFTHLSTASDGGDR